jgi:Holliday junction resolvase
MKETKFTKELRDSIRLKWPKAATFKIPGNAMSAGLPDIIAIIDGITIFIEVKVLQQTPKSPFNPLARLTERQTATIRSITRAGAPVYVAVRFSPLHAVIIDMRTVAYPIDVELIKFDPNPEAFKVFFGRIRHTGIAISQRRSGGVWDNIDFLAWG